MNIPSSLMKVFSFFNQNSRNRLIIDPINEAYDTFDNILCSSGIDKWWVNISEQPRQRKETLAIIWSKILDFAEKTDSAPVLERKIAQQDALGDLGPFSRAALCYEVIFPNGHYQKEVTTLPPQKP